MKAILFAAGLGTRLKPLTDHKPKALVELNGKPLLFHAIEQVKAAGVNEIVVNVHHFAELVMAYIQSREWGVPVHISDERDALQETGGGIAKAKPYLKGTEPILAFNVDVISSVDIAEVVRYHKKKNALVTLVVRKRKTSRYFMFDKTMRLTGWKNLATGESKSSLPQFSESEAWAFSGIHVLSPDIFDLIVEEGKFSVVPLYLRLAATHKLVGFPDQSDFWLDLGKPGQIELAEAYLQK